MFPLSDTRKNNIFPILVVAIIALNIVVFIIEILAPDLDVFIYQYALVPARVDFSDITTLTPFITSMFMHGGFVHIISNLWFLWVFGDNVEADLGKVRFILFYLAAGIIAAFSQYIVAIDSTIPMLGASGAIAGVLGYYLVRFPDAQVRALIVGYGVATVQTVSAKIMLGIWGLTQFLNSVGSVISFQSGGVAWLAHLGGFLFGVIVALIVVGTQREINRPQSYR